MKPTVVKSCVCCGTAFATLEAFRVLRFVGFHCSDGGVLELRDCACGSTLAVQLVPEASEVIDRLGPDEDEKDAA